MNTRKHPRTMQEAFGPYTNYTLYERDEKFEWTPLRVVMGITYAMALVVLGIVL